MKTWAQINAARIKYINYSTMLVKRILKHVREEVVRGYLATGTIDVPRSLIEQNMQKAYEDIYTTTGTAFALKEVNALKSRIPELVLKDTEDMGHVWRRHMLWFVRTRCAEKIASSTRTAYNSIVKITREVIAEAATEGWGADRVAREIIKRQRVIDNYAARRIARTEVVGASNEGSHKGAGSLGVKTRKIWLATEHGDRREGHWALNGTSVGYDEKFRAVTNEGAVDEMLYPHDPNASAANVIQCRCATAYEPENSYIDQLLGEG